MSALRPPRPPRDNDEPDANADPPAAPPTASETGDEPAAPQQHFPCQQCGAELVWRPGVEALQCQYCGFENKVAQAPVEIEELDFGAHLAQLADGEQTEECATVKCEACAAEVDKPPNVESLTCPFCGTAIVATVENKRLIRPKALLPFKIESDEARARYKHWLGKRWFAPSGLKKYAHLQERLKGVYVPYWTYDADTWSQYEGQRGEHYYVTVGSGKSRRRVRKTRWYPASGRVHNSFNDILVLASNSLPQKHADRLEPWDLPNLVPCDNAYLSGFTTERYQVDLADGFGRAKQVIDAKVRETVRWDIGGDAQRIHWVRTQYDELTFKHILLPVWISAYRFKEKVYRILVNARTGEVQGERPWSWVKIALAVAASLIVIGGIAYCVAQFAGGVADIEGL